MAGIDLLNLDWSVAYQVVIFLLTVLVLSQFLIKPITSTLQVRNQRLQPVDADDSIEKSVQEKEAKYAEILQSVRSDCGAIRQNIREEATAGERDAISNAQTVAAGQLKTSREKLTASIEAARHEVSTWIPDEARQLARKIIGREL